MADGGERLKVVTLNIFSANGGMDVPRIKRQIKLLQHHDPDILCLQEAWQADVVRAFTEAFPQHRAANASATGIHRAGASNRIRYLSTIVACSLVLLFTTLPLLTEGAAAGSAAHRAALCVQLAAMTFLFFIAFPKRFWPPILAPLAVWGVERGSAYIAYFFMTLAVGFAPPIFLWWLDWSGVAPIARAIQYGDPFGLLVLVRAKNRTADGGGGGGGGLKRSNSHPLLMTSPRQAAAAVEDGTIVEAMAYAEQGYLFDGGPWLFWAGWFEATFLYRGAVAVECTVALKDGGGGNGRYGGGGRVRVVNTHLANGVHNRHRMAQVAELAAFCKPKAGTREEAARAAGGVGGRGASKGGGFSSVLSADRGAAANGRAAVGGEKSAAYEPPTTTVVCCDSNGDSSEPEMRWLRRTCLRDSFLCHWGVSQQSGGDMSAGEKEGGEEALCEGAPRGGLTWDNENTLTHGNLVEPDQRIDFIFLTKGSRGKVLDSTIIGDNPPLSDHYGVMSTFGLD